jgi:acetoacetate decarboxylase
MLLEDNPLSFVKTIPELMKWLPSRPTFFNAEVLWAFWETTPNVVKKLLPPPLESLDRPLACLFVANYPRVNFLPPYKESALFLLCRHKEDEGLFCLAMPVSDDMAMVLGREGGGFPKKIGDITLQRDGTLVTGTTTRRGIKFLEVEARLMGKGNVAEFPTFIDQHFKQREPVYLIKSFPTPNGEPMEIHPHLVKQTIKTKRKSTELGEVNIQFFPSELDPWAEVEVVKPLGGIYTVYDLEMMPSHILEEIPAQGQFPFLMYDFFDVSKF